MGTSDQLAGPQTWFGLPSLLVVRGWTSTRVTTCAPLGPERCLGTTRALRTQRARVPRERLLG